MRLDFTGIAFVKYLPKLLLIHDNSFIFIDASSLLIDADKAWSIIGVITLYVTAMKK